MKTKLSMKICIIHYVSSLENFLANIFFKNISMKYNWCKKDIQHFCIGRILFSENEIIRSVVGGKVDCQILFDA